MPFNLTIWKINTFFLILYGEISVLIGPIPRLFVTGAYKMSFYPCNRGSVKAIYDPVLTPLKQTALLLHGLHFVSLSREKKVKKDKSLELF